MLRTNGYLMEMQKANSSWISEVGYNRISETLVVNMKNGYRYEYYNVPLEVANDLMTAESTSREYNSQIKGNYRAMRTMYKGEWVA